MQQDLATGVVAAGAKIEVRELSHWFKSPQTGEPVHALDRVELRVERGEFVTVVGPSGCGKSTLLKAIAGLIRPTQGHVECDGVPVTGPGRDRGVVFQELAILPWRTVGRNIGHGLEIQKRSKDERKQKIARYIDLMGLSGFEHHYPHQLSGGMKQRVAVARTWAAEPEVILMDEPFAAVDAQTRLTLQSELIRLSLVTEQTVFFITHNVDEAVYLGDRVIVLGRRPGKIKATVPIAVPRAERDLENIDDSQLIREAKAQVLQLVRAEVAAGNEQE